MADYVGTTVEVPGASKGSGILRFVGQIRGKPGVFGGIELQGPFAASRGKNNGDVDGVRYFEVSQPMAGLFLPWDRLRAVNAFLPTSDRLKSRPIGSKRDSVYTPTPSRRGSPSPKISSGHSGSSEASRSFSRTNSLSRGTRLTSASPVGEMGVSRNRAVHENGSSSEIHELQQQLEQKTRDFDRKEAILSELQATVDQLHPVLEDYERNLEEKDRRLKKQRAEYDHAREEWRSSLDLMLSSQQEAENLYELQINDLQEEIRGLVARISSQGGEKEITGPQGSPNLQDAELKEEISVLQAKLAEAERLSQALERENDDLKAMQLQAREHVPYPGGAENDVSEEMESLRKKVDMLTQDVTSMEIVLQDAQAKSRAKSVQIAELEIKLDEMEENASPEVSRLSDTVEGLSLGDWKREKSEYEEKITALESKLREAGADKELASLRETERQKTTEISELHAKIKTMEAEVVRVGSQAPAKNGADLAAQKSESMIHQLTEERDQLHQKLDSLQRELEARPAYDDTELSELQQSLEMVENMHKSEMASLRAEFSSSQKQNARMESELLALRSQLAEASSSVQAPKAPRSNYVGGAAANVAPDATITAGGALPIYKPTKETDASAGRDDWCGLCERDGHDSLNCPYENDMF